MSENVEHAKLESFETGTPGDGSGAAQPTQEEQLCAPQSAALRATGPRTLRGKEKSSRNAVKSGIFSAVLLRSESRAEYAGLVRGLREYFRPKGTMEESLVEKLAMLLWRHRRLVRAEAAEIAKVSEFVVGDRRMEQVFKAEEIEEKSGLTRGMLHKCQDPEVYKRAIEHLKVLRRSVEEGGINLEEHSDILHKIYGPLSPDSPRGNLFFTYVVIAGACGSLAEETGEEPRYSKEEGQRRAIKYTDEEIVRLECLCKDFEGIEAERSSYEADAGLVPPEGALDRLLRYEARLDRAFDRTLTQLERLQRFRLGQPVPPPVRVEVVR